MSTICFIAAVKAPQTCEHLNTYILEAACLGNNSWTQQALCPHFFVVEHPDTNDSNAAKNDSIAPVNKVPTP
jgi:hypothetical protein